MEDKETSLRSDICKVAQRLALAGFMTGSDGNLSTILNDNEILITPSRITKGYMEEHHIVRIDRQGRQLSGDLPPTSETSMHLAAYEERPDICSVVHCHPPMLVGFTLAGLNLPSSILPEIEVLFGGEIPLAPYATPGGPDVANSIRPLIRNRSTSVVILDHHGVIGVGRDIYQASNYVEHAEAAAKMIFYARLLGGEKPLPPDSLEKLREVRKRILEMEKQVFTGYCQVPECSFVSGTSSILKNSNKDQVSIEEIDRITKVVIAEMKAKRK
ncbi:MAG: class II aldolase/adducin family protein [Anaerolineales bacterium]|jgi:L-fuculose-phosphate aldolase